MRSEDQPADQLVGLVGEYPGQRLAQRRVDGNEIGVLAGFERASDRFDPERPAPSSVPRRNQSSGPTGGRRSPNAMRAPCTYAPARITLKIERSGPPATSEPSPITAP